MATNVPKKLGKYDVLDVVGRGGMGIVYKAIDPGIGRLVAIKMMTAGFVDDPDLLKRFYREAQSAGKLQHPNIVTIYDLGDQDGNPYMVMQFLEGESLDSIIASRRPVSLEQKLNTVIQVCNGLSYAHQHNVIHRDIKPANVMVLKDLTVKIVDFGIARIGNENVTRPGQLMGSVPYMSPEQIKDKAYVDARTDIFSVGVLLYQFLTNALPFDGKDMGAILLKIIHDAPPPLRTYLPAYPAELDAIIANALAKNPEERYATADHLAFDLTRVQEELKRDMVVEYLKSVDNLVAESQWNQAKEQILQILRIDRQNSRASELLRKVEQQIQTQKRSEQARELRVQAEQAIAREELGDALRYLDNAVELDSGSHELRQLRDSVAERKARADQLAALLQRAESARDTGELEEAQKAVSEALLLERDNREAQALSVIIAREIAEHSKLKQVQGLLDEARKRIASRSFTAALEVLKKADMLAPAAPGIKELANLATSGQEQERRRRQLERFNAEVEEALSHDNFVLACAKADEGLQIFPEDRGLLKLKRLAEKQRQASEKRTYVEGQVAAARQLLDSADPDQSLIPLEEALKKYPQEPALISMLSVVKESLARRREEQRKADCIQRANNAIRRKAYTEAIEILEAARKEITSSDLDDLLQFAQEEAANYATRQKIDAVADQARQFISAEEYQQAIDLLAATLQEVTDEELTIIVEDARRRLQEFNQKVQETVTTAERLLKHDRYSEAVRFLEAQFEQCGKAPEVAALLEQARRDLTRLQSFSVTKENARDALSKNDFPGALAILQQFLEKFGETQDTKVLQKEIEVTRSRAATAAMEKALPDVRMLLKVRSFDSAEGILDNLSHWGSYAAPAVKEQYESLLAIVTRFKAQRASSELAEKLNQARVADEPTAATTASPESEAAGVEIGSTDAMSRSQLEVILGEVVQIGDHYQDNEKVQSAIQDFKRLLTLRIGELEEKVPSEETQVRDTGVDSAPQPTAQASAPTPLIEREPPPVVPGPDVAPDKPQSDLALTQQYGESAPPEAANIPEHSAGIKAAEALRQSEQEALRQQEAVRNAVAQGEDLLSRGQAILAMQILQQAAAQHPGQSEIDELLSLAESDVREQQIVAIEHQAHAEAMQGEFKQALNTLEEGLKQFPDSELLGKAGESVSAALRRAELLAEARRLRAGGEFRRALELVETGLQTWPEDRDLKALKIEIETEQAQRQRQEAIAKATEEAQRHLRDGKTARAIEVLQRCSTQFPDDESVSELLRTAEERLRIETEQAKRRQEAIAKATEEAQGHLRDGQTARAIEALQRCSTQFPDDESVSKLLRAAEERLRIETEQAQRQRQEAIAKATEKAQKYLRDGKTARAIEVLQRCSTQFPDEESISKLLRAAEAQLRTELELKSIRTRAETLVREGREEEAVILLEKNLPKDPAFEELLTTARSRLNAKRREELLSQAVQLQRQGHYVEAHGLTQQAMRQYGSTPAASDLERTLQDQIEAERRQKSHDAARDELLAIERQIPTTKQSKLKKLAARAQQIASPHPAEDEVAVIAMRICRRIDSQIATAAPPKPLPVRQITAGAAAILVVVAGIVIVPRLLRVTTVPVEIRTDPPGASVRVGDRSCLTPNCRLDLKPGQYRIEAKLDGYRAAEQNLTVDSGKQIPPINLRMQPVPPPPSPPEATSAAPGTLAPIGTLVVKTLPDASVSVDGVPRGNTDGKGVFSVQLEAKSHQIRVEKPGYQTPADQQVDIAKADSRRVTFKLARAPTEAKPEKVAPGEVATTGAQPSGEKPQPPPPSSGVTSDPEAQDWNRVSAAADPAPLEEYLKKYPSGPHKADAESKLQDLVWERTSRDDVAALQRYLERFPKSPHAGEASAQIEAIGWKSLDKSDRRAVSAFLGKYPNSTHRDEAKSFLNEMDLRDADTKGIQAALDKFNAAFEYQKTRELKDIWPGVTSTYLEQLHPPGGYKVVFILKPRTLEPVIQAGTAAISCDLTTATTPPGGQTKTNRRVVTVRLRKTGDRWLITDPFGQ